MWVKVSHATGFSLGGGKDKYTGDVFNQPTQDALPLLQKGWVVEATPAEVAEAKKALAAEAKERAKVAQDEATEDEDESGTTAPGKKK